MSSLGNEVYCGSLNAKQLVVSGAVRATHKIIGADEMNQCQLHQSGSVFYIKYSSVHQASSIATVNASDSVTITATAAHEILVGDTVHVGSIAPLTAINGIPAAEFLGTHVVTARPSTTAFEIDLTTAANATATDSNATPIVRVDRYRYTDLTASSATWTDSTTLPTPGYTNEVFFS